MYKFSLLNLTISPRTVLEALYVLDNLLTVVTLADSVSGLPRHRKPGIAGSETEMENELSVVVRFALPSASKETACSGIRDSFFCRRKGQPALESFVSPFSNKKTNYTVSHVPFL